MLDLISETGNVIANPFFSVCIETHNRDKTIYRALESLLKQGINNFECIVVDDSSDDKTLSEIKRFISSDSYLSQPYYIKVYKNKKHLGGVLNWNTPLKYAKGLYIAVLEGDDYFQFNHLKKARNILLIDPNIGIYATGSQRALRPVKGFIDSKKYFQYTYQIINISPPSETIFIRLNKRGIPYQYDIINNTYAPELELLLTISYDGWDVYHTSTNDVYREPSTSSTNMTWKYFEDKFRILYKYKNYKNIDYLQFKRSFQRQFILATRKYLVSDYQKKGDPESIKKGIQMVLKNNRSPNIYIYCLIFNTILLIKKIRLFCLYFVIKKQLNQLI